jgi:hypothetical protein
MLPLKWVEVCTLLVKKSCCRFTTVIRIIHLYEGPSGSSAACRSIGIVSALAYFPQTYSMAGLILSAMRLSRSWEDRYWRG